MDFIKKYLSQTKRLKNKSRTDIKLKNLNHILKKKKKLDKSQHKDFHIARLVLNNAINGISTFNHSL